jgi:hypothetical protein
MAQPEKKFRAAPVSATIWSNEGTNKAGEKVEYKSISLERNYKDKEGNWKSTNSLRTMDLPKAVLVLNKAYEYLQLKEDSSSDSSDNAGNSSGPENVAEEEIF